MVPNISSLITFLYYENLTEAEKFFGTIMQLPVVEDEGWAKVYQISDTAFVGVVKESKKKQNPKCENAVLVTFCVEDVAGWYERLKENGVKIIKEVSICAELQIVNFFIKGPGNYMFEFIQYLDPGLKRVFHR